MSIAVLLTHERYKQKEMALLLQNKIEIESQAILEPYLNGFRHDTSGLTFTSLFMWRNLNHFRYEIINDMLCISGINYLEPDQELFIFRFQRKIMNHNNFLKPSISSKDRFRKR